MTVDLTGVALVVAAIGGAGGLVTAVGTFYLQWSAAKKKDAKDARDDEERAMARANTRADMQTLSDKSDAVHTLVDGRSSRQEAKIDALSHVISKGETPPQMAAADAAPGQVTQDGDVVSVGKPSTTPET